MAEVEEKELTGAEAEKEESIKVLKESAEKAKKEYESGKITAKDVIADIIFFFVYVGIAFGWMLLMLLILSFVTLSYLHFEFDMMLIISGIAATLVAVLYIVKKVKKYRK